VLDLRGAGDAVVDLQQLGSSSTLWLERGSGIRASGEIRVVESCVANVAPPSP
jgi:hypothetical protein